eukprot:TRINITY_DN17911_c0_g1_i2.p1 TRINITY_DN17911_c0_g1~~TRINITY_DN17911_c0_g1_i2.p1  ORF type:complete len:428 (+),score=37.00 TRINITY_DN17911_c0_g1_i2:342-1625(+)
MVVSKFSTRLGQIGFVSANNMCCSSSDHNRHSASCSSSTEPSSSTAIIDTVKGSHHFVINGYSLAKGMGVGKYMASDTFSVGGYDWAVYFYPDGKGPEDNSAYVSLFIALASDGTDVRALFELTLLDQSGNGRHKTHTHFDRNLESGPYTLKYRGSMWGYKRFFRRSALETSDYIKNDCLSIQCTVGVVGSRTEGPKIFSIPVPESAIGQDFGYLLDTRMGADVTFEVDGEIFSAHKLVLAARSPVFKAQFLGPMRDSKTNNVKIEDMEPQIFKAMLHFIYRDSLPDMHDFINSSSSPSSAAYAIIFQHLLVAADRYGLDRLRLISEERLCDGLMIDTVATTLALAEQHQCVQLKSVCINFIASSPAHLKAVIQTEGFEYLKKSCPYLLHEVLESFVISEKASGSIRHQYRNLDGSDINGRRVRQRI